MHLAQASLRMPVSDQRQWYIFRLLLARIVRTEAPEDYVFHAIVANLGLIDQADLDICITEHEIEHHEPITASSLESASSLGSESAPRNRSAYQ